MRVIGPLHNDFSTGRAYLLHIHHVVNHCHLKLRYAIVLRAVKNIPSFDEGGPVALFNGFPIVMDPYVSPRGPELVFQGISERRRLSPLTQY